MNPLHTAAMLAGLFALAPVDPIFPIIHPRPPQCPDDAAQQIKAAELKRARKNSRRAKESAR